MDLATVCPIGLRPIEQTVAVTLGLRPSVTATVCSIGLRPIEQTVAVTLGLWPSVPATVCSIGFGPSVTATVCPIGIGNNNSNTTRRHFINRLKWFDSHQGNFYSL